MKFKPNVRARRKGAEPSAASVAAGGAGPSSHVKQEDFADLINVAKSEAPMGWQQGGGPSQRGRGRGRGGAPGLQRQHQQVTFGAGIGAPAAPPPRAGRDSEAGPGPGSSAGSTGGGTGKGKLLRRLTRATEPAAEAEPLGQAGNDSSDSEAGGPGARPMLDYEQFYPTQLPLARPGEEACADSLTQLPDLCALPVADSNAAEELGLTGDCPEAEEHLMLFQMPCVLPAAASAPVSSQGNGGLQPLAPATSCPPTPASLRDLQPGKIGTMLVFRSGAVKMRIGDVLFDVFSGAASKCRQDMAAINLGGAVAGDAAWAQGQGAGGHCVFLGDVPQRAIVTPDLDQLLADKPVPDWPRGEGARGVKPLPDGDPANVAFPAPLKAEAAACQMEIDAEVKIGNGTQNGRPTSPHEMSHPRHRRKMVVDDDDT